MPKARQRFQIQVTSDLQAMWSTSSTPRVGPPRCLLRGCANLCGLFLFGGNILAEGARRCDLVFFFLCVCVLSSLGMSRAGAGGSNKGSWRGEAVASY